MQTTDSLYTFHNVEVSLTFCSTLIKTISRKFNIHPFHLRTNFNIISHQTKQKFQTTCLLTHPSVKSIVCYGANVSQRQGSSSIFSRQTRRNPKHYSIEVAQSIKTLLRQMWAKRLICYLIMHRASLLTFLYKSSSKC